MFFFTFKIPVSRCKLVFLEPGHSCSGPCFQSWAWVSVWEGFSLRKWSCPFVSLPYLLHLVVWFIHDLQLTPWPTSSLHIRFRTCSNPITTLMYNYCNLVHPFLTNPHEPPVPQDVICKTKWNIWNKITLRLCSSLGFSHHHVFPHLPPPEIPSGNQTWQWKIPYKWRLKAGNTTTKKTWGFLKTNCKWRFFPLPLLIPEGCPSKVWRLKPSMMAWTFLRPWHAHVSRSWMRISSRTPWDQWSRWVFSGLFAGPKIAGFDQQPRSRLVMFGEFWC